MEKKRYILYARKSSESEDRQIQSLDDQVNRCKQLAQEYDLDIVDIYREAKSAKQPHNRPIFDQMIQRIEKGEIDGILCWEINRLTRNPIDSGTLSWLLQQGKLKVIQTIGRRYLPDDNVLLFNVESGQANQYILDLKKNVRRGLDSKFEKGWLPNHPPLGYMNDRLEKTITKDPGRYPLVRKIFDLMLTGSYNPPKILDIANKEWGLRTPKTKRQGGKELSRSGIYRILTNPFYAGTISYNGKQNQGKHEPMITFDEFDRTQTLLGRKGKPRPKKHEFAFTGLIRCGECGCLFTAEHKNKLIKSTGKIKQYTYYRCTRHKKDYDCKQRGTITQENLELQIEKELDKYTILPEFRDWAIESLKNANDKEIEDRSKIHENQCKTLLDTQKQLDNLTKMRLRDLLSDDEYIDERNRLQGEITHLKGRINETEARAEKWLELTEKTFDFATYARKAFLMGDTHTKREIVMALGSNPIIKDKIFRIEANKWLQPIGENYHALKEEYLGLEPDKIPTSEAKTNAFADVRARWLGDRDLNPDSRLQRAVSYH